MSNKPNRPCVNCGKEFPRKKSKVNYENFFCSKDCFKEFALIFKKKKPVIEEPVKIVKKKHKKQIHKKIVFREIKRVEPNSMCINCGKPYRIRPAYLIKRPHDKRFCSRVCYHDYYSTIRIASTTNENGYICIVGYIPLRKYPLHRYLMEQHIGRKLSRKEHVHHINGDKLDNRIENLEVLSIREHALRHPKKRMGLYTKCHKCGKELYRQMSYVKNMGLENYLKNSTCHSCFYHNV